MPPLETYRSKIGSQSTRCQVHTGAYVSLLTPGESGSSDCHPRKTTTNILHVVSITTHSHDRRKSFGEKKQGNKKKMKAKKVPVAVKTPRRRHNAPVRKPLHIDKYWWLSHFRQKPSAPSHCRRSHSASHHSPLTGLLSRNPHLFSSTHAFAAFVSHMDEYRSPSHGRHKPFGLLRCRQ